MCATVIETPHRRLRVRVALADEGARKPESSSLRLERRCIVSGGSRLICRGSTELHGWL
jgi:hypothetical protein